MGWHPSQMRTGALTRAPPKLRQVLTQSRRAPCLTHSTPAVHTARQSPAKRSPGRALHGHQLWQLLPEFRSRTAPRYSARTSEFILTFSIFFLFKREIFHAKKDYIFFFPFTIATSDLMPPSIQARTGTNNTLPLPLTGIRVSQQCLTFLSSYSREEACKFTSLFKVPRSFIHTR